MYKIDDFLTNSKLTKEKTNLSSPLHYILKLGDDYYHQQVGCNSVEDMEEKARALETKIGRAHV